MKIIAIIVTSTFFSIWLSGQQFHSVGPAGENIRMQSASGNTVLSLYPGGSYGGFLESNTTYVRLGAQSGRNVRFYNSGSGEFRFYNGSDQILTLNSDGFLGLEETSPAVQFVIGQNLGTSYTSALDRVFTIGTSNGAATQGALEIGSTNHNVQIRSGELPGGTIISSNRSAPSPSGDGEDNIRFDADVSINQISGQDRPGLELINESFGGNDTYRWEIGANDLFLYYDSDGPAGTSAESSIAYVDDADGSWNESSDLRLKEQIEYLETGVLDNVLQLKPAKYYFKRDQNKIKPSYGFIAQEVDAVFPDITKIREEDGYYSLNYNDFGVLAIQAIKEQQVIIEKLEDRIIELEKN